MIPYGRQNISDSDIDAVVKVLKSDFLTQGPAVPLFEKSIAQYCDAQYAVAVNSATSALHIACLALGIGDGDAVWTSPITFVASANCVLYCGAKIDFVDIEPHTGNISVEALRLKLEHAERRNCMPKAVIPVHLAGEPCDMAAIHDLARQYNFSVIEDASHAIGGRYKNHKIGSCKYSDVTVFSFHPVKIITTGEGGMALTNRRDLAEKMELLRSHGITRDSGKMTHASQGPWYYQQIELGFNYRMTDMQAALGLSQMNRLNAFVARRHELARLYDDILANMAVDIPYRESQNYSSLHLYIIRLRLNELEKTRREVFEALRENGVGVNVHYIPVHTQPYYRQLGFNDGDYPNAEAFYERALSLPLFPDLRDDQVHEITAKLRDTL